MDANQLEQIAICIVAGIGMLIGIELGRAFSFWKW